jgi:hypothetical protein
MSPHGALTLTVHVQFQAFCHSVFYIELLCNRFCHASHSRLASDLRRPQVPGCIYFIVVDSYVHIGLEYVLSCGCQCAIAHFDSDFRRWQRGFRCTLDSQQLILVDDQAFGKPLTFIAVDIELQIR